MRVLRGGLVMVAMVMVSAAGAKAATPTVETWGYLPSRDGTLLRYDLLRPAALAGQHLPVLVNYRVTRPGPTRQTTASRLTPTG